MAKKTEIDQEEERNEIESALIESTVTYFESQGETKVALTVEYDLMKELSQIERLMKDIGASEHALFALEERKRGGLYLKKFPLGERFIAALNYDISEIRRHFERHAFTPHFELFEECVKKYNLDDLAQAVKRKAHRAIEAWCRALTGCVTRIRTRLHSRAFKSRVSLFRRVPNENYLGLCRYIDRLFEKHSRLIVIRLDLGFGKEHRWPNGLRSPVTFEEAIGCRERLFNNRRCNRIFKHMVGYAWKLEYGLDKGFHYHLLLLFDGSKRQQDVTIAMEIGEYWEKVITNGKGVYWNCNGNKQTYKACGIGRINRSDIELRATLKEKVAIYLTKVDVILKLVMPDGHRSYNRGGMPKLKEKRAESITQEEAVV
ncbi:MAG: inovirus-type Gp2 protein [Proteobacteria bacterium]|nr:inovirus-type Gp2 protein [Pseudomonadota bacterium]